MDLHFFRERKALTISLIVIILAVVYWAQSLFVSSRLLIPTLLPVASDGSESLGGGMVDYGVSNKLARDTIMPEAYYEPPTTAALIADRDSNDVKIIKTGGLNIEVEDVLRATEGIKNIASKLGGFVLNADVSEDDAGAKSGFMVIKVPVAGFDQAVAEVKAVAVFVANENINGQDVTEEYADLEAQLKNLRAEESQYLEILKRAFSIKDTLEVTAKLADVRGRIEMIEGRIKYLANQTDFSTINISLYEESEVTLPTKKWRPWTVVKQAAANFVNQLQEFVSNIIKFIFWSLGIMPYLVMLAILYWLFRRYKH